MFHHSKQQRVKQICLHDFLYSNNRLADKNQLKMLLKVREIYKLQTFYPLQILNLLKNEQIT